METKQLGYFKLPTDNGTQMLHFSVNAWFNLKEDTGMEFVEVGTKILALHEENVKDLEVLNLLTDVAYAAAKAYDQEEGNEIKYNRYNVRAWMGALGVNDSLDFWNSMVGSTVVPEDEKK